MDNLARMGYPGEFREMVLGKTLNGYKRILKLAKEGKTLRNRNVACTATKRCDKFCDAKE